MAEVNYTKQVVNDNVFVVSWTLTPGDTAVPFQEPDLADVSVSMEGTWGGATVTLKGSNGTSFQTLHDPYSNDVAATADSVFAVVENTLYRKPVIASGSGSSVTVYLLLRRNRHS